MKNLSFMIMSLGLSLIVGCASTQQSMHSQKQKYAHPEKIYFEFNKNSILIEDESLLKKIASSLKRDKQSIAILEGHTDAKGSASYNEVLGEKRARTVRVYLRDQGVDASRLTVISKGERQLASKGNSEKDHQLNRRVEIILTLTK